MKTDMSLESEEPLLLCFQVCPFVRFIAVKVIFQEHTSGFSSEVSFKSTLTGE